MTDPDIRIAHIVLNRESHNALERLCAASSNKYSQIVRDATYVITDYTEKTHNGLELVKVSEEELSESNQNHLDFLLLNYSPIDRKIHTNNSKEVQAVLLPYTDEQLEYLKKTLKTNTTNIIRLSLVYLEQLAEARQYGWCFQYKNKVETKHEKKIILPGFHPTRINAFRIKRKH